MSISPTIAQALAPFAPPDSDIHRQAQEAEAAERAAIAADLAYQALKDSGAIWREEIRRAAALELQWRTEP